MTGRKRPAGHGGKYFAAGIRVHPELHYFVKPQAERLFDDLRRGKYCLLTGHRQSGKSTSISYVASRLVEETQYLPVTLWRGLVDAKEWSAADMWLRLCKLLRLACPDHFPPVERGRAYDSDDFVEAFNAANLQAPVVLIIDEADTLLQLKEECIDELLHNVRFLKSTQSSGGRAGEPTYKLWTMLLVGTDRVKDLIQLRYHAAAKQPGYELSHFPHDHALSSVRFSPEDIELLLQQFADDFEDLKVEVGEIAESIFQLTAGHKGLAGTCLAFMDQESAYTIKAWNELAVNGRLVTHVFSLATYARVMQAVTASGGRRNLRQQLRKFVEQARIRYRLDDLDEDPVRDYIASGVLVLEEAAPYCYLKLSSPLLRTVILARLSVSNFDIGKRPPRNTLRTEDDRVWVLTSVIELLDGNLLTAPGVLFNNDTPSEYSYHFAFMARLKVLLEQAYPAMGLQLLTQVREIRVPGEQRSLLLRAATLVVNGPAFHRFAVEFLVFGTPGANGTLGKHYNEALVYAEQHSAVVYLVNITLDAEPNQVVPDSPSVVFVGVKFTTGVNVAKVNMVYCLRPCVEFSLNLKPWTGELDYQWAAQKQEEQTEAD